MFSLNEDLQMIYIKHLRVNAGNYIGEINLDIESPQIRALLSSDTVFLDSAMGEFQKLAYSKDVHAKITQNDGKPIDKKGDFYFIPKQEKVIDGLTVTENIFLKLYEGAIYVPAKAMAICRELFEKFGYTIPLDVPTSSLTVSQRKFIEIYRAYIYCPAILVVNEITGSLSYLEMICLNRIFSSLKERGTTIICLSTRWEDATKIADSISVFIEGKHSRTLSKEEALNNPQLLHSLMNDVRIEWQYDKEREEQRQWMKVIAESILIEDQRNRANKILKAYCDKACKAVKAEFCRIFLYRKHNNSAVQVNCSSNDNPEYGKILEESFRVISTTIPLFFSTSKNTAHRKLFVGEDNPQTVVFFTTVFDKSSLLILQLGHKEYWIATEEEIDIIRFIANEMYTFIENNQLKSQTIYLQESNHRVKNNMQMILNFLMLQRQSLIQQVTLDDDKNIVDAALDDLISRVMSIYYVHNALACEDVFSNDIDLLSILKEIKRFYSGRLELYTYIEIPAIPKTILMPTCIMLNELMNNSVKHNTHLHREIHGKLHISQDNEDVVLCYSDDGAGVTENKSNENVSTGIGMRLIRLIVQNDFNGKCCVETDNGYHVKIVFPVTVLEKSSTD